MNYCLGCGIPITIFPVYDEIRGGYFHMGCYKGELGYANEPSTADRLQAEKDEGSADSQWPLF